MQQDKRGYCWTLAGAAGIGLFVLAAPDSAAAAPLCEDPATAGDKVICGVGAAATGGGGIAIGKASSVGPIGVSIGSSAGSAAGGSGNVMIGATAGNGSSGADQTFIGRGAGENFGKGTHEVCPIGGPGTFHCVGGIGDGWNNLGIGINAGKGAKGSLNSYVGWRAGENTDGFNNVGQGAWATAGTVGSGNIGIGTRAGRDGEGDYNISLGDGSGRFMKGGNNIAIGTNAGAGPSADNKRAADHAIAIGTDSMAATESVAIGTGAQATGKQSIAIGHQSQVTGNNSGAFGDPNVVSGNASYAFGNDNKIESDRVMVLGNDVIVGLGMAGAVVLGDGSAATAAVAVTGVKIAEESYDFAGATTADGQIVSVGAEGAERQVKHVAAGQLSATSTDAVNGSQLHATNSRIETLNNALGDSNTAAAATQQRLDGVADRVGVAETRIDGLTGRMGGAETRIDGLTGRMGRAETRIESLDSRLRRHQTSTTNRFERVNRRIDRADSQIVALGGRLDDLTRDVGVKHQKAMDGVAAAMALGSIQYDNRPGKLSMGIGAGHYGGGSSLAMGLGYMSDDQRFRLTGGGTYGGQSEEVGIAIGLSWTLN